MRNFILPLLISLLIQSSIAQTPSSFIDNQGNRQRIVTQTLPNEYQSPIAGNPWNPIGPFGGDIIDLGVDPLHPDKVFAVGGLPFISENGGNTWTILSALAILAAGSVNAIETTPNGITIATGPGSNGKVFRSTNGGLTWQTKTLPVNTPGLCIAVNPLDTNIIYVGLSSNLASTTNKVIVKSSNGGLNWTAIDMTALLAVGYSVTDICCDPDSNGTVFAIARSGFTDASVVASFDGGLTWEERSNGLPSGKPYNKLAIAGNKVFIAGGQLFGSQNMGVYESTDYGLSWTNISTGFPNKVSNSVIVDPLDDHKMYVATEGDGIYLSTDGGNTWNYNAIGAGEHGAGRALICKPASSDVVYAGFLSIAVCKSGNSGINWAYANNGIATLNINDIEIDRSNPARAILAFEAENSGGCYLSADTGSNWTLVGTMPGTRYSKVTIGADGALYAWSNGPSTVAQEGLYKSTDNGLSWTNKGPNIGNAFETEIWAITPSATNPDLIFIGGNNFGNNGWASMIYRTTNGGNTWENIYQGSPDNGESFKYLHIQPGSNDQVVYASYKNDIQGGILKSTDGGTTWGGISDGIPGPEKWFGSIVSDPADPNKLLAGTGGYGTNGKIYSSVDGGNNWVPTSMNIGAYSKICDLAFSPANSNVVYAATTMNGAYISTNGGTNWLLANDGIPTNAISAFTNPFQSGNTWNIIASTTSNSAFRTEIFTPGAGISDHSNDWNILIYPNPSHGLINIDLSSCKAKIENIQILDASGRVFKKIEGNRINSSVLIISELPSGLYFCQVLTDKGYFNYKLLSLK